MTGNKKTRLKRVLVISEFVGCLGVEPSTSFLSGKRSTAEPAALLGLLEVN